MEAGEGGERPGALVANGRLVRILDDFEGLVRATETLRSEFQRLREESIPKLEQRSHPNHLEKTIVGPHRDHIAAVRQELRVAQERRQAELVARTLALLETDVDLACSLRLLSTLKQQREFLHNPLQLVKLFLRARTRFISTAIRETVPEMAKGEMDPVRQYAAVFKVMQGPVLDAIRQYRVAFSDLTPLVHFVAERLEWFCETVEQLVARATSTLMLASFWNQAVLLDAAYAATGASFLPILEPAFAKRAADLLTASAKVSLKLIRSKYGSLKSGSSRGQSESLSPPPPSLGRERADSPGKDLHPPPRIAGHPGLALIVNSLVEILEQGRVFAVPYLREVLRQTLHGQFLGQLRELLSADDPPALEELDQQIAPFVDSVLAAYFTPGLTQCSE